MTANPAPRLATISNRTVQVGDQVVVRPQAVDPDRGPKALRYSVSYAALGGSPSRPTWLGLDARTGCSPARPAGAAGHRWTVTRRGHRRPEVGHADLHAGGARAPPRTTPRGRRPRASRSPRAPPAQRSAPVKGSDPDGDTLTWALTDPDAPFAHRPRHRHDRHHPGPRPRGHRGSYDLTVRASDGTLIHRGRSDRHGHRRQRAPVIDAVDDVDGDRGRVDRADHVEATDPDGDRGHPHRRRPADRADLTRPRRDHRHPDRDR